MNEEPPDPPGSISDQNREDAPSAFGEDRAHPEPRTDRRRPEEAASAMMAPLAVPRVRASSQRDTPTMPASAPFMPTHQLPDV